MVTFVVVTDTVDVLLLLMLASQSLLIEANYVYMHSIWSGKINVLFL